MNGYGVDSIPKIEMNIEKPSTSSQKAPSYKPVEIDFGAFNQFETK